MIKKSQILTGIFGQFHVYDPEVGVVKTKLTNPYLGL